MISAKRLQILNEINNARKDLFTAKAAYKSIKRFNAKTTKQIKAVFIRAFNVGKHYRRLKKLESREVIR